MRSNRQLAQEEGKAEDVSNWETQEADLNEQLKLMKSSWERAKSPVVTAEDIAEVVAMWTGVPVMQIAEAESKRLLKMEEELQKSIIGQEEAIQSIAKAVRRARAGLKDPKRPIGSFMFLGPTGVGKTELTKALAKFMFGSEEALIQLDMSEFMERHTASRLVGAPPGYIGYDDAGQLTEALRRRPYSIVVFDEVEKAHPEAAQHAAADHGRRSPLRCQGSHGGFPQCHHRHDHQCRRRGDQASRPALGFQLKRDEKTEERTSYEEMRKKLTESLKKVFRPEFINRLDSVIVFRSLNKDDIRQIVNLELNKVTERLAEHELSLTASDPALDLLAEKGYDPEMGARPLRRVIQQKVEDPLSDALLSGTFNEGDAILVEVVEDEVVLKCAEEPAGAVEPV